jgi:hypothetical protein
LSLASRASGACFAAPERSAVSLGRVLPSGNNMKTLRLDSICEATLVAEACLKPVHGRYPLRVTRREQARWATRDWQECDSKVTAANISPSFDARRHRRTGCLTRNCGSASHSGVENRPREEAHNTAENGRNSAVAKKVEPTSGKSSSDFKSTDTFVKSRNNQQKQTASSSHTKRFVPRA